MLARALMFWRGDPIRNCARRRGVVHIFGGRFAWAMEDGRCFVPTYFCFPGVGFWSQKARQKVPGGGVAFGPHIRPQGTSQQTRQHTVNPPDAGRSEWGEPGPFATNTSRARRPKFGADMTI